MSWSSCCSLKPCPVVRHSCFQRVCSVSPRFLQRSSGGSVLKTLRATEEKVGDNVTSETQSFDDKFVPPPEKDFWEGEQWEWLGKSLYFLVPATIALAIGVGFFAANTYNEGATTFLQPATSPEDTITLFTLPGQADEPQN